MLLFVKNPEQELFCALLYIVHVTDYNGYFKVLDIKYMCKCSEHWFHLGTMSFGNLD